MGSILAEKLLTVKAGNMCVLMLPSLLLLISYCRTCVLLCWRQPSGIADIKYVWYLQFAIREALLKRGR